MISDSFMCFSIIFFVTVSEAPFTVALCLYMVSWMRVLRLSFSTRSYSSSLMLKLDIISDWIDPALNQSPRSPNLST